MTKVSVLLPSYNVRHYISECLESVTAQTLKDIEILCIDAGSTDGTLEIIKEYAARDSRIRLILSERRSYGYQMNKGIEESQGEYIGIVETDDYISFDMYEKLYNIAKDNVAEVVKGTYYEVYESESERRKEVPVTYIPNNVSNQQQPFNPQIDTSVHMWDGGIWNGIYNRDFILDNNILFNESEGAAFQDIGFQQLVLNYATMIVFKNYHFYYYRKVRKGASTWTPKCILFLYQEYKRLIETGRICQEHIAQFYLRMITAFIKEFNKAVMYADYNYFDLKYVNEAEWFRKEINNALMNHIITYEDIIPEDRERILLFLFRPEMYVEYRRRQVERLSKWLMSLREKKRAQELVLFGMGSYGQSLMRFLIVNGLFMDRCCDNNPGLWNISFYGVKSESVEDAVLKSPNALFLIANKNNSQAMKEQLTSLGIDDLQILVFDGNDTILVNEIRRNTIIVNS